MQKIKLKTPPLVEAILEIKWVLPPRTPSGVEGDPHYRLLLGRFSERVEKEGYLFHEALPTVQVPDMMAEYMVQHRFRMSEGKWPLIQIGPGIMTVNETDGYTWDDFGARCKNVVTHLFEAHPAKEKFEVQSLMLRYINAVEVDFSQENIFTFLQKKMQMNISLPDGLFDSGQVKKNPTAFNWQTSFSHDNPGGIVTLGLATGKYKGEQSLIWETSVQSIPKCVPSMPDGFSEWIGKSHNLIENWFFKLIEGELERRFSGE